MIALALALLSGAATHQQKPDPGQLAAMTAVRNNLTDPESARFRAIRKTGPSNYCGWVNAKNGYGGYAGEQLFYDDGGFVQIFDMEAVYDAHDMAARGALLAKGDFTGAEAIKPRLSETGKKVEPCLQDRHGD